MSTQRILCYVVLTLFAQTLRAESPWDLQGGISALEEGDDRYRAGLNVHLGYSHYSARYFYFEQGFGPVKQTTHVLAISRSFSLAPFEMFSVRLGLAPLLEHTRIHYAAEKDASFNRNEYEGNLGLFYGLIWEYREFSKLRIQCAWETALYPAGLIGGILLVTGRKQLLSFSIGMSL